MSSKISSVPRKSLKRYILKQFFYKFVTTSEYISCFCEHSFRAQGFINTLRESLNQSIVCQKISCSTLILEIKAIRNKFLNVSACFSNLRMVFAKILEWII